MSEVVATNETIMVVGGGISGLTAALEAAECGKQVLLIEKAPTVGGRVGQMYKYFPKLCFPTCGLEIQYRRLKANKNIRLMTMTEVSGVSGEAGNYSVDLKVAPRYVNENCTACGDCSNAVEAEVESAHNYGMMKKKAAYLPHNMAYPQRYVIDPSIIGTADADKAKEACKVNAVDLDMQEESLSVTVGAIIWSTGWKPYDAAKIQPYGYDRYDNVISNVEFERMMDPAGPTGGKIQRADGSTPNNIAFIQCAGSRDRNHLKHCSRVCCMASLKQTTYVAEQLGDACKSTIYYIDIRAIDRIDDFHQRVKQDPNVSFIKSKVANVTSGADGNVTLNGVDTEGYNRYANEHDLVVLATGMESTVPAGVLPEGTVINEHGFIDADESNGGIFGAGCSSDALDVNRAVQNATAAALRAIQVVNQVAGTEG
jgi:quinone-modifying oxidoreductase subunit QmoA